jgi:ubiquinone/menaquinone biosynthesis C-methylase UbiE
VNALNRVRHQWTTLGERDPLWAILSETDKKGGGWDQAAFFQTGVDEIGQVLRTARSLAPVRYGSAVDFGCGVGRLSQALSMHFQRVVGVDIAESMIRSAVLLNRLPDRCEYIHNVAADLSVLPGNSADLIYSSITLQHVVPALARCYIREFFRVARPGALVIFQLPCRPRSVVWHAIKSIAPIAVANMIWRLRTGSPEAMETYSMRENKVIRFVEQSGGEVLHVEDNQSGPAGWQSRKYYCIRRALP